MLKMGPTEVNRYRDQQLRRYTDIADNLKQEEEVLKSKMHHDVAAVVRDKKIILFKQMLQDADYDDIEVVDYLIEGVKVMGTLGNTGVWKPGGLGPSVSVETVLRCAKQAQSTMLAPRSSNELDKEVWSTTMEEVDDGLLAGPFTPHQVAEKLGPLWTGAKRFGLKQGQKVRPIDDFSVNLINSAFGAEEKIVLDGLEEVTARTRAWMEIAVNDQFNILDKEGVSYTGVINEEWGMKGSMDLVGRVADLRRAYKQVPLSPCHAFASVISVLCPSSRVPALFVSTSLSFGQTAAVYAFLRISRALAALAARLFFVGSIAYSGDFTKIEPVATAESAIKRLRAC